jgi:hypothetical protein
LGVQGAGILQPLPSRLRSVSITAHERGQQSVAAPAVDTPNRRFA